MSSSTGPLRVAIYARVSTLNHGQDTGLSGGASSLDELRQVAAQRGWEIVGTFTDEGVSGAKAQRPGLDRLLRAAQLSRFDLVAVWKLDRLGRDLSQILQVIDTLSCLGVGFASVRDPGIDSSTPGGRLMLQVCGAFAAFEREMIRERVIAGVRRAQANGKHCGRPRKELDLRPAVPLLREGRDLKEVARILRMDRNTLRRRLRYAGAWPLPGQEEAAAEVGGG